MTSGIRSFAKEKVFEKIKLKLKLGSVLLLYTCPTKRTKIMLSVIIPHVFLKLDRFYFHSVVLVVTKGHK